MIKLLSSAFQAKKMCAFRIVTIEVTAMLLCHALLYSSHHARPHTSEAFLKITLLLFLDTLILLIYFLIIKINNFRGDLSDASA